MGSFLFSFLFGTAAGMNLLISIAVKVIPEEQKVEITDVKTELVELTGMPTPVREEIPIPEVLAAGTEEQEVDSQEPVFEIPTDTPTKTLFPSLTLANTSTPTPSQPLDTPTPILTQTATPSSSLTPSVTLSVTPTSKPSTAPVSLDELFTKYSNEYHVDMQLLKKIAKCESNFNTGAIGPKGLYVGMFQFGEESWQSLRIQMAQNANLSLRTDAEESIKTASFAIAHGRVSMWPSCSKN